MHVINYVCIAARSSWQYSVPDGYFSVNSIAIINNIVSTTPMNWCVEVVLSCKPTYGVLIRPPTGSE